MTERSVVFIRCDRCGAEERHETPQAAATNRSTLSFKGRDAGNLNNEDLCVACVESFLAWWPTGSDNENGKE